MLLLIPAVIFSGGASLPTQTVLFTFAPLPEKLLPLADKGVIGELTDSPAGVLKGEPPYNSAPLYGAVVLGADNRFIFSLDGNTLYFDSDRDGDLRNNRPLASPPAVKGLFRKTLLSFPPVLIQLSYPEDVFQEWQEYRLAVTCDLENKTFSVANFGYRVGTIIFLSPAKNVNAAIYDANPPNGIFSNFGKDFLLIDLNRDGEFDISSDSPEKVLLAKTLDFGGNVYVFDGSDSGEYIDIHQLPAGKQPSGAVAITYVTEQDRKKKVQSGEGEPVFRNGGFQVVCSRGPAAFRRGSSSEAFIKHGELTLYDSYNRPWKARFLGNPLTPAAVLTSFPSQFRVGFPFEQKLLTDKEAYRPGENVVVSMYLVGQAKETYTYFALGDVSRQTQPSPKEPNKIVFEERKPRLVIKDPTGNAVAEGDMALEPPDRYQVIWRIPAKTDIPDAGALYRATVSWDTGSFQGVVKTEAQFSVVKR